MGGLSGDRTSRSRWLPVGVIGCVLACWSVLLVDRPSTPIRAASPPPADPGPVDAPTPSSEPVLSAAAPPAAATTTEPTASAAAPPRMPAAAPLAWRVEPPEPDAMEETGALSSYYERWRAARDDRPATELRAKHIAGQLATLNIPINSWSVSCRADICRLTVSVAQTSGLQHLRGLQPFDDARLVVGPPALHAGGADLILYAVR